MSHPVDFGEIVDSIKTYSPRFDEAPIEVPPDKQRHMIDTLHDLMHAIMENNYDPKKCAFYMHPRKTHRLVDEIHQYRPILTNPYQFDGRPIYTHPTIPEDTILFMAPDSVSLGGKVYVPNMIAYTELSADNASGEE